MTTGLELSKVSKAQVRAYARLIDAGMRTIDEVEQGKTLEKEYRVAVYLELIADTRYKWTIEQVDPRYVELVKTELGIQ